MSELYEYEIKDIIAHFPEQVSQEIVDYATNVAFKWSRYIFTRRVGKRQYGYCTHCKQEYETEGLKHGTEVECINCNSNCVVKASGKGRSKMVDDVYFVYYHKSLINPEAITAIGIYAIRDYRGSYYDVETQFVIKAYYLFEPGRSRMLDRYSYFSHISNQICAYKSLNVRKKVFSLFNNSMKNVSCYYSRESIKEAVKGTPFQYSTWEQYFDNDMVRFFDLYSKYPCIEYLTKMGLKEIVLAKLEDRPTYGSIHWRGKTPLQVLRLTKQELNEIKASQIAIGPLALRIYQMSKKDKSNLPFREIYEIVQSYGSYLKDIQQILKYTTIARMHAYTKKQYAKIEATRHYVGTYQVLHMWRDYINDCIQLEMDLKQDSILFPSDLHKAHQDTIAKIKSKEDKELSKQIRKRLKSLKRFCFETSEFFIRPVYDTAELIREGNELNHCVGRYAKQYAKGETNIFVIRRFSEPNKPFYTMEIKNDHIVQTRGLKNCSPTEEVQAFIKAFTAEKLTKKQVKQKVQIALGA